MKLMFASDIHGSEYFCEKICNIYRKENADRLVLLGDLLYHGPRNDLPQGYNPKGVINLLNGMKNEILAVRGNCDAEVDQMVLEFPCLADYMIMYLNEKMAFITHGHLYNNNSKPLLKEGDLLIHGHTHVQAMEKVEDYFYINPGSVSLPKEGNKHSYMIYENGRFTIKSLDMEEICSCEI